jgi:hypothetical protein
VVAVGGDAVTVRLIGYWRSEREPWWPHPRAFVDPSWDESEREVVATYLETAGFEPWSFAGHSRCRICGVFNGCGERCDGVYIWPDGLPHYIRAHDVRLPPGIVKHIVAAAHSSDENASRRAVAALREDGLRLRSVPPLVVREILQQHHGESQGAPGSFRSRASFVVDKDFWAHAKLG